MNIWKLIKYMYGSFIILYLPNSVCFGSSFDRGFEPPARLKIFISPPSYIITKYHKRLYYEKTTWSGQMLIPLFKLELLPL